MDASDTATRPLAGLTVVDLTTFLSGPFATQIISDLGARIIKVEPLHGDSSRTIPPHFIEGDSAYYLGANRGKESVSVDLKTEDGLDIVTRLIEKADVVIENFRPGVIARLGLDPQEVRTRHPRLIWVSISGFGRTGDLSHLPAYDMVVQALSGVMSLTGEEGRPASRLGIPAGDLIAGLFAAIGLLSAVVRRNATGEGALLDVSMLDGQLSMLSYQATYAMLTGTEPRRQGAQHDSISTYRSFTGSDGREFVITANTEEMWKRLCDALQRADLADDPRFESQLKRLENRHELWPILEAEFLRRPSDEWISALQGNRVPAARINTVLEALAHAEHYGRDMVMTLESDSHSTVKVVGNPVKFVGEEEGDVIYPPRLGQHTDLILDELGFTADERSRFRRDGIINS